MANLVFTLEDGSTFSADLDCDLITIGRHEDSMIPLPSPSVSSHHATLRVQGNHFYVQDLGSRNGTRVNGAEVEEAVLNDGDRITFGDVQAVYCLEAQAQEPPMAVAEVEVPVLAAPVVAISEPPVRVAAPVVGVPPIGPRGPQPRGPQPRARKRTTYAAPSDGCFNGFAIIGLFIAAFAIGLSLRHYQLTERFLLSDLADRVFSRLGRIKIEQTPEQ
jgi:pSer/pThr/pTyr-binding forkhead associated (FHA) protein